LCSYADNHIGTRGKPGVPDSIYNDWMDVFYANVSAYGMIKPYMLSPGNHEAPCDYTEYNARAAAMPFRQSKSTDVQYYSYTVGPVHVVALSGEAGRLGKLDALEIQWLEADLAEAAAARERGEIGWIITHVHYPNVPTGYCSSMMSYCCADGRTGLRTELEGSERYAEATSSCVDTFMTDVNKYVEDMFVKYHVDVHLTAHQHVYERTTPVYRYQAFGNGSEAFPAGNDGSKFVNPKYPININNGCPGNVELQDVWMPRPKWSVGGRYNGDGSGGSTPSSYTEFGFVKMAFEGTERATFDYVDSKTGKVLDSFVVER
jgi:3',5'-cyclic AMP phosphodiesterase CpdA